MPQIIPKKSTVAAKQPTTSDLALGEIAINHADAKLYARHPVSGAVQEIGGGGGGSVTIDATAADLFSFSSGTLSADDLGSDTIFFWDDSANKATGLSIGTGLSISGTTLRAGTKTYAVFTPRDSNPPSTAFATLDTRNSIAVLDFDDGATNEATIFCGVIPEAADLSAGLIVSIRWMATSATTGVVRWGVQLERGNTDLDADSFDTAVEANTTTSGTAGIPTVTEITTTSLDGLIAGDLFRLRVYRDSSDTANDTMTGDAELIAVEVRSAA